MMLEIGQIKLSKLCTESHMVLVSDTNRMGL
jgi:hypothetical protein